MVTSVLEDKWKALGYWCRTPHLSYWNHVWLWFCRHPLDPALFSICSNIVGKQASASVAHSSLPLHLDAARGSHLDLWPPIASVAKGELGKGAQSGRGSYTGVRALSGGLATWLIVVGWALIFLLLVPSLHSMFPWLAALSPGCCQIWHPSSRICCSPDGSTASHLVVGAHKEGHFGRGWRAWSLRVRYGCILSLLSLSWRCSCSSTLAVLAVPPQLLLAMHRDLATAYRDGLSSAMTPWAQLTISVRWQLVGHLTKLWGTVECITTHAIVFKKNRAFFTPYWIYKLDTDMLATNMAHRNGELSTNILYWIYTHDTTIHEAKPCMHMFK